MNSNISANIILDSDNLLDNFISSILEDDFWYFNNNEILHIVIGSANNQSIDLNIYLFDLEYGDTNQDSTINILDVTLLINYIIGGDKCPFIIT